MRKAEEKGSDLKYSYMFWLPLIAVLREGIETVIFLAGTSSNYDVRIWHIMGGRLFVFTTSDAGVETACS